VRAEPFGVEENSGKKNTGCFLTEKRKKSCGEEKFREESAILDLKLDVNSSNGGVRCTASGTQWDPPTGKMSSPTLMLQMNGVANLDPDISQVIMLEGVIGTSMTFQQETRQYTGTKCCACHEKTTR